MCDIDPHPIFWYPNPCYIDMNGVTFVTLRDPFLVLRKRICDNPCTFAAYEISAVIDSAHHCNLKFVAFLPCCKFHEKV